MSITKPEGDRRHWLVVAAAGLVLLSVILGGGGAEGPILNGVLEAGGTVLLCACFAAQLSGDSPARSLLTPLLLLAAVLAIVAFQLLPMSPSFWTTLPGREAALAAATVVDGHEQWRPLTLDAEATRRWAASLLLPAGILLAGAFGSYRHMILLGGVIVAGALASGIVGAIQLGLGNPAGLMIYDPPEARASTGFFANPNHQAQLMLAGIVATGLIIRSTSPQISLSQIRPGLRLHLGWFVLPLLSLFVVTADSQAGILLLPLALGASLLIALKQKNLARLFTIIVFAGVAIAVVLALTVGSGGRLLELQSRYSAGGRLTSYPDILFTLSQFWPWGSGFGTFVPVFKANENLDLVSNLYLNHAHNDYLELLIEGGLPIAVVGAAVLLAAAVRVWRLAGLYRSAEPAPALTGLAILCLFLIHSLVDYPLRMHSIAAVAAVALVLFVSPAQRPETTKRVRRSRSRSGFGDPIRSGSSASGGFGQ